MRKGDRQTKRHRDKDYEVHTSSNFSGIFKGDWESVIERERSLYSEQTEKATERQKEREKERQIDGVTGRKKKKNRDRETEIETERKTASDKEKDNLSLVIVSEVQGD